MTRRRVFLVSIGVCLFVGVPAGTVAFGALSGDRSLVSGRDTAGVPFLVYAFISAGPFATIAGFIGGAVLLAFLRAERWNPAWYGWVLACAGCGVLAALGVATAMALVVAGQGGEVQLLLTLAFLAPTGGLCGAVLGLYGWSLKQRIAGESQR